MNLAVMADGMVGFEIVRYLANSYPDDVAIVVTTEENEIASIARDTGFQTLVWGLDDSITGQLCEAAVDLGVLAWWPHIVRSPLLASPTLGWVNTHPSLLPHNRGKHYNFWAIVEQAPFGVTLHFIDEGVDTGDVISQMTVPYDWTDSGETLYHKAQLAMIELFSRTYPSLRIGEYCRMRQDLSAGSFHRSGEIHEASHIDLDQTYAARELINLLRARTFPGHPSCWFEDEGVRYEISVHIRKGSI